MGAMPISGRRSRGEDGRPLRLRTPAIRRDGPTVQGPPAFSPAQGPRAGCRPILPQRTSGVMLTTPRVHASIWSRTLFQNAVFKLSMTQYIESATLVEFTGDQGDDLSLNLRAVNRLKARPFLPDSPDGWELG